MNTFLNRVSSERKVLKVINERLPKSKQLSGLSSAAMASWRSKLGVEESSKISETLVLLAKKCQRLSDRSNETFTAIEALDSEKIEIKIAELKIEFEKYQNLRSDSVENSHGR